MNTAIKNIKKKASIPKPTDIFVAKLQIVAPTDGDGRHSEDKVAHGVGPDDTHHDLPVKGWDNVPDAAVELNCAVAAPLLCEFLGPNLSPLSNGEDGRSVPRRPIGKGRVTG